MRSVFFIFALACFATHPAFPEEPAVQALAYAQNFTIEAYPNYKLLTVQNAYRHSNTRFRYVLVPREKELPAELPEDAVVIPTPVRSVAIMETVYVGYLDALGQLDLIRGAATAQYISHPKLIERVHQGSIQRIQSGQVLNIENLLLLKPELILSTSLGDGQYALSPQLKRAGLPVVITADYMEEHPLARTEWLKFLAPFFECESQSEQVFTQIEQKYKALLRKTKDIAQRPSVFCGAPYSGVWHVPGGDSFIAQAITDAGARYVWEDDSSQGGIPLDTERVYLKAADADFWIHPSAYRSLSELFGADPRFSKFRAAQVGNVYNNSKQVSPLGGNNIWERGIVHPEEVLADLIRIFHPELMPDHELIYYEQLK